MKRRSKKLEPKLALAMPFGELLERLVQTKPSEVEASIKRAKQRRPESDEPKRRAKRKMKGPAKLSPRRPHHTS
ncbi:MAG TPA: hypothetical protein VK749_13310 [Xanthobacteraceae bacterium]|jgi:hypothetical protein|nr:hypothetical protein [Xanthobacteraceae bacterium]